MNRSVKGALLSALVFPGVGQIWLKLYIRGIALIVVVLAAAAVVVKKAAQQAFAVLEKIESEGGAVDIVAILRSASHPPDSSQATTLACGLIVLCWIVGIVDAYVMGRKMDMADQSRKQRQNSGESSN